MLKISDENLLWRETQAYWRRFAASVTGFADRYRFDPFLRTQVNVIGMLAAFSLFLLVILGVLFEYIYHDVSLAIITGVRESILSGENGALAAPPFEEIASIRTDTLSAIAVVTAIATVAFGYLVTRVALTPTRNALASQKQFIGNIAHELRTPLTSIKTNTEVALLGHGLDDTVQSLLNSTVEDIDRMSDIINNLLSLSSSVRPERIELSPIDAASVADEVVRKLEGLARMKHLDVILKKSDACYVWGNAAALEQIVMNVVKNAINYTPRGGHVSVLVEQIGASRVEITVQDSGEGISRQDLFHIFEPFYRADASRNRARGAGSGLGLTIVAELVKLHRGKITVRSALGRGTTVLISIPGAPNPSRDPAIRTHPTFDEVAVDYSHRRT